MPARRPLREDAAGAPRGCARKVHTQLLKVAATARPKQDALRDSPAPSTNCAARTAEVDQSARGRGEMQGTLEERIGESSGWSRSSSARPCRARRDAAARDRRRRPQAVLSKVKTTRHLGRVQLGNLLDQLLTSERTTEHVEIVPGTARRVEFAIRARPRRRRCAGMACRSTPSSRRKLRPADRRLERGDPIAEAAASAELVTGITCSRATSRPN